MSDGKNVGLRDGGDECLLDGRDEYLHVGGDECLLVGRDECLRVGGTIEINIDSLNHSGEGVGHIKFGKNTGAGGFAVFAPGALPGETVRVKIEAVRKNYARASVDEILCASPHRAVPPCAYAHVCGGCQLQHLAYEEQLRFKRTVVEDALLRIGGLRAPVAPPIPSLPYRYRNKVQMPVGMPTGMITGMTTNAGGGGSGDGIGPIVGFYGRRSHDIVPIRRCLLQPEACDRLAVAACRILGELGISIYDERSHTGLARHLLARYSFSTGNILAAIVTNGSGSAFPQGGAFTEALRQAVPEVTGVVQNVNTRRGNTVLGAEDILLWGSPQLTETLDGLSFAISPQSFFQINPAQATVLYKKAVECAGLTGAEVVFDLYCGSGGASLFLARHARRIIGVESAAPAVQDARENARRNSITNAEFHTGAAEAVVPRLYKDGARADVVVVDPPRKGCDPALLGTIADMGPRTVVYISCNPATLARDLRILDQKGYSLESVQPIDMFPQTAHIEVVASLVKQN
ncbi:MAG: 23S rRNA (uracil(1939)-C(5))-methyltransferase RlmD [Oscillospiraceae bacterium]|nr:23S rRNA (uracil(1939)-C(5))-methyltransferase RlmD [Oscillospiraceae bacterium]